MAIKTLYIPLKYEVKIIYTVIKLFLINLEKQSFNFSLAFGCFYFPSFHHCSQPFLGCTSLNSDVDTDCILNEKLLLMHSSFIEHNS